MPPGEARRSGSGATMGVESCAVKPKLAKPTSLCNWLSYQPMNLAVISTNNTCMTKL
jgi:hypothetical protein